MNPDDIPLADAFHDNPLEYMQHYVRNLNNEIFLSEYHINNLYALLLIGRNSPWDGIKGNHERTKQQIDSMVNQKVVDVKAILQSLSNMYEDKVKKSAITQIQKLMGILKAKKKSIFIEKDRQSPNFKIVHLMKHLSDKAKEERDYHTDGTQKKKQQGEKQVCEHQDNANEKVQQSRPEEKIQKQSELHQEKCQNCCHHLSGPQQNQVEKQSKQQKQQKQQRQQKQQKPSRSPTQGKQVFGIFVGLANLSNLSAMALTNVLEYNSAQRFIKFKMSDNYIMTIKNEDPIYFDRVSQISKIPTDLFVQQIFPFLSASELFGVRSVCKEWLQNVKDSWHATFKREMFVQLLACQFCKDIQFFYKMIQLRNPFFQKLSLLIHALIEIIQWDNIYQAINNNTLSLHLKRVLIIVLRLIGEPIQLTSLNNINDAFFDTHKHRLVNIKEKVTQFFGTLSGSDLSINDLRIIKTNFLDDPFMRVEQITSDDKSPLLLTLFVKQMTLQQILRNHIFLSQQYLLNTKKRLDNISKKMVYQKGYLEGVYKVLLLKSSSSQGLDSEPSEMPNFSEMLQSIFTNRNSDKPDFVIRSRHSMTQIFLDNATKLDIILSTVDNLNQSKTVSQQKGELSQQKEQQQENSSPVKEEEMNEIKNEGTIRHSKIEISKSVDLKIQCKENEEQESIEMPNTIENSSKVQE